MPGEEYRSPVPEREREEQKMAGEGRSCSLHQVKKSAQDERETGTTSARMIQVLKERTSSSQYGQLWGAGHLQSERRPPGVQGGARPFMNMWMRKPVICIFLL